MDTCLCSAAVADREFDDTADHATVLFRFGSVLDAYLAADGIDLSSYLLDRIDQIVPPGVTINVADNMWEFGMTALDAAFHRR